MTQDKRTPSESPRCTCVDTGVSRSGSDAHETDCYYSHRKTEHEWGFIMSHGNDAPNESKDTIEQCKRCGVVRHDYRHNGGQTTNGYPRFWRDGVEAGTVACEPRMGQGLPEEARDLLAKFRKSILSHSYIGAPEKDLPDSLRDASLVARIGKLIDPALQRTGGVKNDAGK